MVRIPEYQSPREEALVRMITLREVKYLPELLQDDWKQFAAWPDAVNCRLAAKVIVDNVLNPSPLAKQIHQWIDDKNCPPLVLAVAMQEASYSNQARRGVYERIIKRHNYELTPEAQRLMYRMEMGEKPSWTEIAASLEIFRFQAMPPQNQPELTKICCRLMTEPSAEGRVELAKSYVKDLTIDLARMPQLRWALVRVGFRYNVKEIIAKIETEFSLFADEIVDWFIKIDFHKIQEMAGEKNEKGATSFTNRCFRYARQFADRFSELPPARQIKISEQIYSLNESNYSIRPWLLLIAPSLSQYLPNTPKLIHYLYQWFYDVLDKIDRDTNIYRILFIKQSQPEFIAQYLKIPEETRRALFNKAVEFQYLLKKAFENHRPEMVAILQTNPDFYTRIFSSQLKAGQLDGPIVLAYIEAMGENAKEELTSYLENVRNKDTFNYYINGDQAKELIRLYIMPWNLAAGPLLLGHWDWQEKLLDAGYEIKQEDVATKEKILAILPKHEDDDKKYDRQIMRKKRVWQNEQWRGMLLQGKKAVKSVIGSLLTYCPELLKTITLESHLRRAICELAWENEFYDKYDREKKSEITWSNEVSLIARNFLAENKGERLNWRENNQATMMAFIDKEWREVLKNEFNLVDAFMTLREQRDHFFKNAHKKRNDDFEIDWCRPEEFSRLFPKQEDRQTLCRWLVSHSNIFVSKKHLLRWIGYCSADLTDPKLKDSVLSIANRLKDNHDSDVVKKAIAVCKILSP